VLCVCACGAHLHCLYDVGLELGGRDERLVVRVAHVVADQRVDDLWSLSGKRSTSVCVCVSVCALCVCVCVYFVWTCECCVSVGERVCACMCECVRCVWVCVCVCVRV